MPLQIVYGAAGTGKSSFCRQDMLRQERKAILIVPEQFSHIAETQLIEEAGYLCEELQATSFARLAKRLLSESGLAGQTIDAAGKHMLMARVLLQMNQELSLFHSAWSKPGFLTALLDLISDFKRAQVSGEMLLSYADQQKENSLLAQKLEELGRIYSYYEKFLEQTFTDAEDYVTCLARLLTEQNPLGEASIYIDGFFRFTANEFDVIRSMLLCGMRVTVTVCTPDLSVGEASIFAPCAQTARRLCAIAQECAAAVLPPIRLTEKHRFAASAELAHLEKNLYCYPHEVYPKLTEDITLYTASDPFSEVQRVAVEIRRTVSEKGYRYRDIAIIAGDMEGYQEILKTVFPSYEIPIFTDNRRELLSHPVMLMLFSVFRILTGGFRMQDVIAYCKTGYAGLSMEEADRLENYALFGHIDRGDWLDDERFLKRARSVFEQEEDLFETDRQTAENMLQLKNRLLQPILHLKEKMAEDKSAKSRAEALFCFFEEIRLRAVIETQTEHFIQKGERQLADEYADVYNLLIETLDQLVLCFGDEKIGIRRLSEILQTGFSEYSMGVIPSAADQVFFGDVNRSLVKNVKLVFLLGAVDGAFPPAAPTEGILTDSERILLRNSGFELAPDTKKIAFDNQFLVYAAVNISTRAVFVSCPVADFEGKGLRPSSLIARLRRIFPQLLKESDLLDAAPKAENIVASKQSAYLYLLGNSMQIQEGQAMTALLQNDEEYRSRLLRAEQYRGFSNFAENLSRENVEGLYGKHLKGSISRFEKFSACPFSFFIQFGLKARERKILEMETPDIGWLLHAVIDAFSRRMAKEGESYHDLTKEHCEKIVDGLIAEMSRNMFLGNLYSQKKMALLLKRLKKMVMKSVWVLCEHIRRGEFEPCAFEVSFDDNGEMPPVTVNLPTGESITLAGRIDRIDRYSDGTKLYIRVIDYKSGNKEFSLNDIFHRLSLQLAVYMTAVCEGGERFLGENARPAGMFYFRLNDPIVSAYGKSEEELEEEVLKKFKMSGLVLSDADVIRAMDKNFTGYSKIIPVRLNKDGEVLQSSSKSVTMEQMERLQGYMKKAAADIGREILNGNTSVAPYCNEKGSACTYCRFRGVCGFDSTQNNYRYLKKLSDDEVWEKL